MGIVGLRQYILDKIERDAGFIDHVQLIKSFNYNKSVNNEMIINKYVKNKTLALDFLNVFYNSLKNNTLSEDIIDVVNFFTMTKTTLIFVFDGKQPVQKNKTMLKRKEERITEMKNSLCSDNKKIKNIYFTNEILKSVKNLLDQLMTKKKLIKYIIPCDIEADNICVNLVKKGIAWACISDDSDMFMYGCPRVFQGLCIKKKTMMFYNFEKILIELFDNIPNYYEHFLDICIISGTDYNPSVNCNFKKSMNIYYNEFLPSNSTDSFINWINENKKEYYNNMEEYDDVLELIYDNNNKSINLIDNLKQS